MPTCSHTATMSHTLCIQSMAVIWLHKEESLLMPSSKHGKIMGYKQGGEKQSLLSFLIFNLIKTLLIY